MEVYNKNYGVDTVKIVEHSNLKFENKEQKNLVIKSLEKGNIVKVKFNHENKDMQGKAILNPQYKTLNLYDDKMNRINTNKPIKAIELEDNKKAQVKEHNIKRGL